MLDQLLELLWVVVSHKRAPPLTTLAVDESASAQVQANASLGSHADASRADATGDSNAATIDQHRASTLAEGVQQALDLLVVLIKEAKCA